MSGLWAIVWLGILIAVFIGTYIWNKNTPKPVGCEDVSEECGGCANIACTHHTAHNEEEIKDGC